MDTRDCMLTTYDNRFNPFTDFVRWWKEDLRLRHDCCGMVARESCPSMVASQEVNDARAVAAMKRIAAWEPDVYVVMYEGDPVPYRPMAL